MEACWRCCGSGRLDGDWLWHLVGSQRERQIAARAKLTEAFVLKLLPRACCSGVKMVSLLLARR
eukprot:624410-Prorocentrum_lima.AAC.1